MRLQRMKPTEIRERTAYFLEVLGLSEAGNKLPCELSGGMQQRVLRHPHPASKTQQVSRQTR